MRTLHLGPEELLVAVKVGGAGTFGDGRRDRDRRRRGADPAAVPIARVIYLEPDIDRGPSVGTSDDAAVDGSAGGSAGPTVDGSVATWGTAGDHFSAHVALMPVGRIVPVRPPGTIAT